VNYQPYGEEGLLIADVDIALAIGFLAAPCRTAPNGAKVLASCRVLAHYAVVAQNST